jgi:hypothetical protein
MERWTPRMEFEIGIPTRAEEMVLRTHNKFAKAALRHVLTTHHKRNIPRHFKRDARSRYGYAPRNAKYIKYKQRRWGQGGMDLVKTGASRDSMLSNPPTIRMSGSAEGGKRELSGTLILRFAFRGGSGRFRAQNTRQEKLVRQMHEEVRKILPAEGHELAQDLMDEYMRQVAAMPKRKRKRKVTI